MQQITNRPFYYHENESIIQLSSGNGGHCDKASVLLLYTPTSAEACPFSWQA